MHSVSKLAAKSFSIAEYILQLIGVYVLLCPHKQIIVHEHTQPARC